MAVATMFQNNPNSKGPAAAGLSMVLITKSPPNEKCVPMVRRSFCSATLRDDDQTFVLVDFNEGMSA